MKMHSTLFGIVLSSFEAYLFYPKSRCYSSECMRLFCMKIGIMLEVARPYRSLRCSIALQKPSTHNISQKSPNGRRM